MSGEHFVDHYEILQLSPNADSETVNRVYRLLAQRFHPDHKDSGNVEVFHQITESYQILSDPEKRAAFDVQHREERRLTWKIFDQSTSAQGVESERRKRQGILALLLRKRTAAPDRPEMGLREMEELLGVPREHLEFALWYLKEGQYVGRSDNARYTITLKGVDLAESMLAKRSDVSPIAYIPAPERASHTR